MIYKGKEKVNRREKKEQVFVLTTKALIFFCHAFIFNFKYIMYYEVI
jgi:hypothetical protein